MIAKRPSRTVMNQELENYLLRLQVALPKGKGDLIINEDKFNSIVRQVAEYAFRLGRKYA